MHTAGAPVDLRTICAWLIDRGLIEQVGGPGFLAELFSPIAYDSIYPYMCGILRDKQMLRAVISGGTGLIQSAYELQGDVPKFREVAMARASQIEKAVREPEPEISWSDVVDKIESEWHLCYQGKRPSAMPSPWSSFNLELGGVKKGYILLLGEEKKGKSSFMGHLALHVSNVLDLKALIVSYETSVDDYIRRLACNISGIQGRYMFQPDTNRPTSGIAAALAEALMRIRKSNLRVVAGHGKNVYDIAHLVRREKPVFLGVDYLLRLPRLPDCNPKEGTEGEVRANSKALFDLSQEMDGTLMVINHTTKSGDRKGQSRWGDSASNDSDLTLVVEDDGIFVKLQRNGPSGMKLPITFHGACYSFREENTPFG